MNVKFAWDLCMCQGLQCFCSQLPRDPYLSYNHLKNEQLFYFIYFVFNVITKWQFSFTCCVPVYLRLFKWLKSYCITQEVQAIKIQKLFFILNVGNFFTWPFHCKIRVKEFSFRDMSFWEVVRHTFLGGDYVLVEKCDRELCSMIT